MDDKSVNSYFFEKRSSETRQNVEPGLNNKKDILTFINAYAENAEVMDIITSPQDEEGLPAKMVMLLVIDPVHHNTLKADKRKAVNEPQSVAKQHLIESVVSSLQQKMQHDIPEISEDEKTTIQFGENGYPKRLLVTTHGQITVINMEQIVYLKSCSNYTIIKMADGNKYTSSKHLKIYDMAISSHPDFLRVHRSAIVNKNYVKAIVRKGHKNIILMPDDSQVEISSKRKEAILEALCR
ncbi:MAG: LytTR family DNA-binding domain-containing protein [Chitinophagaceae bacterium]